MSKKCGDCIHHNGDWWCKFHKEIIAKNDPSVTNRCKAFEERTQATVFDTITASPEVLAEKLVYKTICVAVNRVTYSCWKSTITEEAYRTRAEAIAATVARLKEVEE